MNYLRCLYREGDTWKWSGSDIWNPCHFGNWISTWKSRGSEFL